MQTNFTLAQLADPRIAEADKILRSCVHCGFCNATCPTYLLLGDELDGPRGRIYLIKDMLENDRPASPELVTHIDRCLSCLSCMTTCPSGVHYMHLVDQARERIEQTYRRPLADRVLRSVLAKVLPDPRLLRPALIAGALAKPLAGVCASLGWRRLAAMLSLAPWPPPLRSLDRSRHVFPAQGERRGRVALLSGCVGPMLSPSINEAAVRLLTRHGIEVVRAQDETCCGALVHHMGRDRDALDQVRTNVDAWMQEVEGEGLDAIVVTASGCGTMVKDYAYLLRTDSRYAAKAARITSLAKDVTEYLTGLGLEPKSAPALSVAYHSACSLQHGQKVTRQPKALLTQLGFEVKDIPEGHICCGSAGTYNLLQPALSDRLKDRKIKQIQSVNADVVATGNIGCIVQIASGIDLPVLHTVELLDWATGGPAPRALAQRDRRNAAPS